MLEKQIALQMCIDKHLLTEQTMIFRMSTSLKQKLFQEKHRKSLYSGEKCGYVNNRCYCNMAYVSLYFSNIPLKIFLSRLF